MPLRRVSIAVVVLILALVANLNWVQMFDAGEYRDSDHNQRNRIAQYEVERGSIMAGRQAVAYSKDTGGGNLRYQRIYPKGREYAAITGYASLRFGNSGVEQYENSMLGGTDDALFVQNVSDTVTGKHSPGANVLLTVDPKVQDAAWNGLKNAGYPGAAVAIDPKTGKILAMATTPTFDPNPLADHDEDAEQQAWDADRPNDQDSPLLNKALGGGGPWPPGSTMKVIVSAAALENGYDPDTNIPAGPQYEPEDGGNPIHNDVPEICPQSQVTLLVALRDSCNTGFARLGVKLGADTVVGKAEAFGLNKPMTIPMLGQDKGMPVAKSVTGDPQGASQMAQSSIGQFNVAQTPLQEAMTAGAIANDGTEMQPYLVQEIQGSDYSTLRTAQEHKYGQPIDADTAGRLRTMMDAVVDGGTGRRAQIGGIEVGGKTGTAEHGEAASEHGWFMGYARDNGEPKVAVGVFIQGAGEGGSATATQIGGDIMRAVVNP
ncbi:MAG: penicillin-binding protein 2 [Actinocatenispora sp.]